MSAHTFVETLGLNHYGCTNSPKLFTSIQPTCTSFTHPESCWKHVLETCFVLID